MNPAIRPLAALLVIGSAFAGALAFDARPDRPVPPLVFVSRRPPASPGVVPGVGPRGRLLATGGELMVRGAGGVIRPLLAEHTFFDVSHPSVSWDARRIVFAATAAPESAWRVWVVDADGRRLAPVTRSDRAIDLASRYGSEAARFTRYDDFDPCWLPDDRLVFASTRFPMLAQQGQIPVSNLYVVRADGTDLRRITTERNSAEKPSIDPISGRIVFARWWFNRYRATDADTTHVTADFARALPADTVDLWQAASSEWDGDRLRLQGGDPRVRAGQMAYQPVVMNDTTLVGVRPEHGSMLDPGRLGLQAFRHGFAAARPLVGFGADARGSACAPAVLPDGRLVFSMDPDGAGEWGLFVCEADGSRLAKLYDRAGTLELDAAVLQPRRRPPHPKQGLYEVAADDLPPTSVFQIRADERRVRFDCLNVFANGPVDFPIGDAPPIQRGLRIRFFAVIPNPSRPGADSLVLVRDEPLTPQGAVHIEDTPSDVPMFEQLVDSRGRVLRSAAGPAHVPGFNYARPGAGTKCVGCHVGHSALFVAPSAFFGEWTNVSPSARVTASSVAPGTRGARAAVDRRSQGPAAEIAWLADSARGQWLRLSWETAIDARAVVVYPLSSPSSAPNRIRVLRSELALLLGGREVGVIPIHREWSPKGTRVEFKPTRVDAIELRSLDVKGKALDRTVAAVAEVETIARLAWE